MWQWKNWFWPTSGLKWNERDPAMTAALQRRLPGVRFDVPPSPLGEVLPRMDIALFVGFTATGPIDVPVAVESLAEFEAVFGAAITLLTRDDGSPLRGLLHPSMRHFFSHGGRRAWILRVAAAGARTNRIPLQQMIALQRDNPGEHWQVRPAWLAARCAGSWSDNLVVTTTVDARPVAVEPVGLDGDCLTLAAFGPVALALGQGDLLRVELQSGEWLQGFVGAAETARPGSDGRLRRQFVVDRLVSLRQVRGEPRVTRVAWFDAADDADGWVRHPAPADGEWHADGSLILSARLPARARLGVGEVLQVLFDGGQASAWLVLEQVDATAIAAADGLIEAKLAGRPWRVPGAAHRPPLLRWLADGSARTALWLSAGLRVSGPGEADAALDGLSFMATADGANSLFDLPDDERFFTDLGRTQPPGRAAQAFELTPREGPNRRSGRFALASIALPGDAMLLPLGNGPGFAAGLRARCLELPALVRDGLDRFSWELFAESALAACRADEVADSAQALCLVGRKPRPLRGIHAVFGAAVDALTGEPTLLAVPDAVQPGWRRLRRRDPVWREWPAEPSPPLVDEGLFADCALTPLAAPEFVRGADPDAGGNFILSWTAPETGVGYCLQESSDARFASASLTFAGANASFAVTGKSPGHLFYRVRACVGARLSDWSATVEIVIGVSQYAVRPWRDADLLAIHRLMLRVAAGHGDLFAVLGLPEDYGWTEAIAHAQALRSATASSNPADPPPLVSDESRALSHGGLHHPWLITRRVDDLIACPPDGAICGQLAASAVSRGAWIAVANQPLRDIVALGLSASATERQALLDEQVNAIVAAPAGFVLGSAETLILDADWRAVNVRRLMSLLRRIALRRGATYVFEPDGATLRRTVERAFETLLDDLFRRGALAGRNASQAYRVEVGESVNTAQRRDAGQFWIELSVAPALPMTFLRVRLSRNGDRIASRELR
jgi:hypothetical protein